MKTFIYCSDNLDSAQTQQYCDNKQTFAQLTAISATSLIYEQYNSIKPSNSGEM